MECTWNVEGSVSMFVRSHQAISSALPRDADRPEPSAGAPTAASGGGRAPRENPLHVLHLEISEGILKFMCYTIRYK